MACTVRTRLSKLLRAFSHDQRGVFSVLLAVLAIPILSFVGLAIDYSRLTKLQANLQSMADSAALAAAVAIKSKPHAHFELHAHHFEKANKDFELSRINYSYTKDEVHHTVTAYLTTSVTNYFGIFLGKRHSPISARAVSSYDTVPPLEIAIAFDVTGSMKYRGDGDSGETVSVPKPDSKAVQAQNGLKKFIGKLTELTDVRAALVPFATVVKVDADSTRYQPWLDWKAGSVAHVEKKSDWEGCIVDRDPGVGPFVSQHTTHYPATTCQKDDWRAVHWTKSTLNNVVQSTDNLTMLKDRIGGLQFDGCTNITLGAYWGGVVLDPNGPIAGAANWGDRKKILLLMSDGMNTTNRWIPIPNARDCARTTSMDAGTIATCDAIKARGIEIYSVNVVNGDPTVLRACASGPNHYFYADSAAKIAKKLENVTDEIKRRAIVRLAS
ncbi:pilus assembly protein TadG-related protein [Alsobacter sp. SYSU BS001988]